MVLLALPPADHLLIERDRGQFVPSRRRRVMANVRAERLLKILAEPSPEQRIPNAAAQTRIASSLGRWRTLLVEPRGIQGALSSRLVSARIIGGKGCRNIPHEILLR